MLIKYGAEGEHVERIQRALHDLGYDIKVDGDFRNQTYQAVRKFQEDNGLKVDGKVGDDTLNALRLDPETLKPSATQSAAPITVDFEPMEFEPKDGWSDTAVPDIMRQKINTYVDLVVDQEKKLLETLDRALDNFETSMSFASEAEATPDVLGSLTSKAFDVGVNIALDHIPGASTAKNFFDAATDEIERAGQASKSLEVGRWIKEQRRLIANQLQNHPDEERRKLLQIDTESAFLERNLVQSRQEFLDQIDEAIKQLLGTNDDIATSGTIAGTAEEMELKLYEQWINAHFISIGSDQDQEVPGCIEYRLKFEENEFQFESCSVKAPFENRLNTALNDLLDTGKLLNVKLPIDLMVRKRVCLRTKNHVGGRSWFCAWIDEDNNILRGPNHPEATKGFMSSGWRLSTERFRA